ncbi:MmcQ/YjbR family DNA-binding protein [Kribbella sp. NPDC020789]
MDAQRVLKVVRGLPGAEEHEGWAGQPAFKVRKKGFAYLSEDLSRLIVKAYREEQEALVAENPEAYSASWESGRFAWVDVTLAVADEDEVGELLTEAWRLTAPKYLIAQLGDSL